MAKIKILLNPEYIGAVNRHEEKDCAVRALANARNIAYSSAHSILKDFGRVDRNGTSMLILHRAYLQAGLKCLGTYGKTQSASYMRAWFRELKEQKGITLSNFIKNNSKGRFVVLLRGHATTVADGKVIDTFPISGHSSVVAVYKSE